MGGYNTINKGKIKQSNLKEDWNNGWNFSNRPVYWGINEDTYYSDGRIDYVVENNEIVVARASVDLRSIVIPKTITINENTYNVTKIRKSAFYNCRSLAAIIIPNSVTSIK